VCTTHTTRGGEEEEEREEREGRGEEEAERGEREGEARERVQGERGGGGGTALIIPWSFVSGSLVSRAHTKYGVREVLLLLVSLCCVQELLPQSMPSLPCMLSPDQVYQSAYWTRCTGMSRLIV